MGFETKLKQLESDIDEITNYNKLLHFRGYCNTDLSNATSDTIFNADSGKEEPLELGDVVIDINGIEYMWDGQKYAQLANEWMPQIETKTNIKGNSIFYNPAGISAQDLSASIVDITDTVNPLQEEIEKIWSRLNKTVSLVHNCQCCGASLTVEENKPVINCKYCGATYLVGAVRDKDRG